MISTGMALVTISKANCRFRSGSNQLYDIVAKSNPDSAVTVPGFFGKPMSVSY